MRIIGHLDNETAARTFGDYLYVQGIDNQVEPDTGGTMAIWIKDEDLLDKAKVLLERFRQNPQDPEFQKVARNADDKRAAVKKENEAAQKRVIKGRKMFTGGGTFGVGGFTFLLIVACFGVAYYTNLGAKRDLLGSFLITESFTAPLRFPEISRGEIWRLFTPVLVHFGMLHIIMNMLWLFQLGSLIEARNSTFSLMALVAVIGVGSNLVQIYWTKNPAFGGMSGVVYGLLGYVWLRGKFDPGSGFYLDKQNVIIMTIWLFLCAFGIIPRIANGAHFGGLIIGCIWGYASAMKSRGFR